MSIKTPLRYPGGKSRAIKFLSQHVPNMDEYREPFLGGGSMMLYILQNYPNIKIWANDIYHNLYYFWTSLQSFGDNLVEDLLQLKEQHMEEQLNENDYKEYGKSYHSKERTNLGQQLFTLQKEKINNPKTSVYDKAISFFILNKCSYAGLTETGTFSPQASIQNFTINNIKKLKTVAKLIKNVKFTCEDYTNLIMTPGKDVFIYLDPPYDILNKSKSNALYGKNGENHKAFDHTRFSGICQKSPHKWMITYNNSDDIKSRYYQYGQIIWDIKYGMQWEKIRLEKPLEKLECDDNEEEIINKAKIKQELLIKNF